MRGVKVFSGVLALAVFCSLPAVSMSAEGFYLGTGMGAAILRPCPTNHAL